MPDAYTITESRFVQQQTITSAAGDVSLVDYAVPAGKVWTILQAGYTPSAGETKVVQWFIRRAGVNYPITLPTSIALTTITAWPAVTEGMELKLFPGEQLYVSRDSATAGSTMTLFKRYIETDLPLYEYVDPQEQLRISKFRRGIIGGAVSPQSGGRPSSLGGVGMGGGRGGVPRPK